MIKYIFNIVKIFRAPSVFQGKRKLLKNLECKKYIQYSGSFQGNSAFQGKRSYSKILNSKKYIQYNENFQRKLCFQGMRKLLKILNTKSTVHHFENWSTTYSYFHCGLKNSSIRLPYQRPRSSTDCARELFNGSKGSVSLADFL